MQEISKIILKVKEKLSLRLLHAILKNLKVNTLDIYMIKITTTTFNRILALKNSLASLLSRLDSIEEKLCDNFPTLQMQTFNKPPLNAFTTTTTPTYAIDKFVPR